MSAVQRVYSAAAVALSLGAFTLGIGHEPLWLDETYSLAMTRHDLLEVVRLATADVHPPLYYLLLAFATSLWGDSAVGLRLPSALAAAGLVALGAGPVRRMWGDRTAWVFATLVVSSSGVLCFAQEARMYTLAALFVSGATLYGQLALYEGRRAHWVAFALFTWGASLTHYFALVAVGWNASMLLVVALVSRRAQLRPLGIATAFAALGFVPWAPFFWAQVMSVTRDFWVPETSWNLVVFGLVAPFAYKFEDVPYPWQAAVASAAALLIVCGSLCLKQWRGSAVETRAQLQLVAVFVLTLAFGLGFSLLVRPIFMPRYMIVGAGLLLLALSVGIARLPFKAMLSTTTAYVVLGFPAWVQVQTQVFNGPFTRLAAAVQAVGDQPPVLVHNGLPYTFVLDPARHAVPEARHVVVAAGAAFDASSGGLYQPPRAEVVQSLEDLHSTTQQIWFVDGVPGPDPVDASSLERAGGWVKNVPDETLTTRMSWVKITLRRYERVPSGVRPHSP